MADYDYRAYPQYEHVGVTSPGGKMLGYAWKGAKSLGIGTAKLGADIALGGLGLVGSAAIGAAKGGLFIGRHVGLPLIKNVAQSVISRNGAMNPIGSGVKLAGKFAGKLIKREPVRTVYNEETKKLETRGGGLKFTKLGMGLIAGGALVKSATGVYDAYMNSRISQMDPYKTSLTPDYRPQEYHVQHPDMAGATGDLVFAMHANRRG